MPVIQDDSLFIDIVHLLQLYQFIKFQARNKYSQETVTSVTSSLSLLMKPIKLKQFSNPPSPFAGYDAPYSPQSPQDVSSLSSPSISLLDARDMKLFGYHPLTATRDIGLVRCLDCSKPVLRSFMAEHAGKCVAIPYNLLFNYYSDLCAVVRTAGKAKSEGGNVHVNEDSRS